MGSECGLCCEDSVQPPCQKAMDDVNLGTLCSKKTLFTKAESGPTFTHGPYSAKPGFRLLLFKLPSEEIPRGGQRVGAWEDLPATSLHGLGSQCLRSSLCLHAEGLLTMNVTMTFFSSETFWKSVAWKGKDERMWAGYYLFDFVSRLWDGSTILGPVEHLGSLGESLQGMSQILLVLGHTTSWPVSTISLAVAFISMV